MTAGDIAELRRIIARLVEERDTARRMFCELLAEVEQDEGKRTTPEDVAASEGWECYP